MRYQRIHSQIWTDEKFRKLSEDAKFLFIYIITCPHSNTIGVFVLPKKYIECDLDWSDKRLAKPFAELLHKQLILFDETDNLIAIVNHLKHNPIENENQAKSAAKILESLPKSSLFINIKEYFDKPYHKPLLERLGERYAKPITIAVSLTEALSLSLTEKETVSLTEATKKKELTVNLIIDDLNSVLGTDYKLTVRKTKELINIRIKEGFTLEDFKKVHRIKFNEWNKDDKMSKFLRPETLYSNKFEGYLNQKEIKQEKKKRRDEWI